VVAAIQAPVVPQVLREIQAGDRVSLTQFGQRFPAAKGAEGTVNSSTVFRWVTRGVVGPNGDRIKLEAVRIGGRWLTSEAATNRWIIAMTPGGSTNTVEPPRSPAARTRASENAGRQLEAMGI